MPFYLAERVFTFDVSVDEIRFDLQIFQAVSVFCYYGEFPGREKLSLILETKCIDNDFSFDIIDMVSVKVTGYIETGSRFGVFGGKVQATQSYIISLGQDSYDRPFVEKIYCPDELHLPVRVVYRYDAVVIGVVVVAAYDNILIGVIFKVDVTDITFDTSP